MSAASKPLRKAQPAPLAEGTLLLDHYTAVLTPEGNGHREYTLSAAADPAKALLCLYEKPAGADEETCTRHYIPYETVKTCYDLIARYKLAEWNTSAASISGGMDGARTVCKFLSASKMVRVSTDLMPENGLEALNAVRDALLDSLNATIPLDE